MQKKKKVKLGLKNPEILSTFDPNPTQKARPDLQLCSILL